MSRYFNTVFMMVVFLTLSLGFIGCKGPGEKYFDQGSELKEKGDRSESQTEETKYYNEAIEKLKIAVEKEPDNYKYHQKLGQCYKNIRDFDNAITAFKAAIEKGPDQYRNYTLLMGVYVQYERFDEAAILYESCKDLDIFGRDPRAKLKLGERYEELKAQLAEKERIEAQQN